MELITGTAKTPHVTSTQHRSIYEMIIGEGSYILGKGELLEPELQSNNVLRIRSGMLCHHGSISEVKQNTYDEVNIGNGSQGMKRIDLVVARYTKNPETEIETMTWEVIQGTPAADSPVAPAYTEGNMQDGDLTDDCPLFEVHLDGIQVTEVVKLLEVLNGSLAELNSNISESGSWELIGTKTNHDRIYIDTSKYKTVFCEVRNYEQYASIYLPVEYINTIDSTIEKAFTSGGYMSSTFPGMWFEIKVGKMGTAEQPYVYWNRGFVNGTSITGNYGLSVWGQI